MKNLKNKTRIESIIVTILLITSIALIMLPAEAQTTYINMQEGGSIPGAIPSGATADVVEETRAFLSFSPNPIGVGQALLVNVYMNPALHVSRYFKDYKITLTKPDGTTATVMKNSYRADTTAWFEYTPDQAGEWKLKFEFPGGYFPAGNYTVYEGAFVGAQVWNFIKSTYYKPSSTGEQKLTVQQNYVYSWPPAPLPTDYWTRPVSLENREWWPILGNYPGTGYVGGGPMWDELYPGTNPNWNPTGDFHPWVQAPDTAHIVWKRQNAIAGLVGGPAGQYGVTGNPGNPSVVYSGRCYQTVTKPGVGSVAQCYDLRTGEIYYEIPTASGGVTPSYLAYVDPGGGSVPGAEAQSTYSVELLTVSGTRLYKVNPWTGAITNISISVSPSLSSTTYYMNQHFLSLQDLGATAGSGRYRLINWTSTGTSSAFSSRIVSNTTYARGSFTTSTYPPLTDGSTYGFNSAPIIDYNAGIGVTVASITNTTSTGIYEQMRIQGYRLSTGEMIWDFKIDEPQYSRSCYIADNGKLAVLTQKGYFLAYDLATGSQAWQSEQMDYPWGAPSFGAYALQSAYGLLYRQSYDGVYAFNWDNGKIAWKYIAPAFANFESPYLSEEDGVSVYPWNTGGEVADGKLFTYNTEHTASWPRTRGWSLHCINATTGEGIWQITGEITPGAIADGYLTGANSWDGYMYVFGKGKSATTVTAPDVVIAKGSGVVIKGTVLDISPAQAGTPCVSKESMTTQMEYLHMQQPIDGIWHNLTLTGVPIVLTALDSDGKAIDIGTATTSGYYGTFEMAWTPPAEGTYKIIASFSGDDSYGSSAASTAVSVGPAPAEISIPEQIVPPDYTMTLIVGFVAVIIAVAIVGLLVLRKK